MCKYENEVSQSSLIPGVVTGLVYTGSGTGKIMFIEASLSPGTGQLHMTGKLGEVIKESAQLALSWVKAHAHKLGITDNAQRKLIDKYDVHFHLPEGATPKDGPSAGIALVCALVSLFIEESLPATLAMTGEITLRGQVLPVGGIKEKVISAHHAGIRTILLPERNRKDVEQDLPLEVKKEIKFHYVKNLKDVLGIIFNRYIFDSDLEFDLPSTSRL